MKPPNRYRICGLILFIVLPLTIAVANAQKTDSLLRITLGADGSYTILAPGITAPVLRATAAVKVDGKWLHAADYPKHIISTSSATGELGAAKTFTIRYTGREHAPDLLLTLRAYADSPFGDLQLTANNTTGAPIEIQALRVLECKNEATGGGVLNLGGPASADRVLSDSFSEDRPAMQLRDLGNVENQLHRHH